MEIARPGRVVSRSRCQRVPPSQQCCGSYGRRTLMIRMLLGLLLMAIPVLLGARGTVSHVLAWDTNAVVQTFVIEQCVNTKQGCSLQPLLTLDGTQHTVE